MPLERGGIEPNLRDSSLFGPIRSPFRLTAVSSIGIGRRAYLSDDVNNG